MADDIVVEREGAIGWLVFSNPDQRNAVTIEMWKKIPAALQGLADDQSVRVVILRGAGDKAFVAGAQIGAFKGSPSSKNEVTDYSRAASTALLQLRKPTIAMVRGYCIGAGVALAVSCDLRIASHDARFGIPAAKLGLAYQYDGTRRLNTLIGPAKAKELLFTARQISAEEAERIGLVNLVVPSEDLLATARSYADMIAANAPLSVTAAKLTVDDCNQPELERDFDAVKQAMDACFKSEDFAEGRLAFAEKRPPVFRGK